MLIKDSSIIGILIKKGLTKEQIISFTRQNQYLLGIELKDMEDKISLIYNGETLYALVICVNNVFYYSLYNEEGFGKIVSSNNNKEIDYIVYSVVNFVNNDKFRTILKSVSLEKKVKEIKKYDMNTNGYRLR